MASDIAKIIRGRAFKKRQKKCGFPKYAEAFALPIRISPRGSMQVGVTPAIKEYAKGFMNKGLSGTELARAIVEDIDNFKDRKDFKGRKVDTEIAQRFWAKRSADHIIRSREIIVAETLGKGEKMHIAEIHRNVILGCCEKAQAAVAALRAAGIPALIAREGQNTYAKALILEENKWKVFIIDPSATKREKVREMTPADKRREDSFRRKGTFAEGISLHSMGLKDYGDFFKTYPKEIL